MEAEQISDLVVGCVVGDLISPLFLTPLGVEKFRGFNTTHESFALHLYLLI